MAELLAALTGKQTKKYTNNLGFYIEEKCALKLIEKVRLSQIKWPKINKDTVDLNKKNTHFYLKNNKFKGKQLTHMENTFEIVNYYVHEEG